MVVDDGRGPLAVAGLDLGQVLPHRDQLHPEAGGGGGQCVEVAQGGDVGRLVEDDEQGRVDRPPGRRPPAHRGQDLVDEGAEEGAELFLVVAGGGDVQRV